MSTKSTVKSIIRNLKSNPESPLVSGLYYGSTASILNLDTNKFSQFVVSVNSNVKFTTVERYLREFKAQERTSNIKDNGIA